MLIAMVMQQTETPVWYILVRQLQAVKTLLCSADKDGFGVPWMSPLMDVSLWTSGISMLQRLAHFLRLGYKAFLENLLKEKPLDVRLRE